MNEDRQGFKAACDITSLKSLKSYLCYGFQSKCDTCESLSKCKYGQRWIYDFGMAALETKQGGKKSSIEALRAYRRANRLCVKCGKKLPTEYKGRWCSVCRAKACEYARRQRVV